MLMIFNLGDYTVLTARFVYNHALQTYETRKLSDAQNEISSLFGLVHNSKRLAFVQRIRRPVWMNSESIKIDPAKGTLTIFVGKDPVVVVRTDEFDRAIKYAKLLRRRFFPT